MNNYPNRLDLISVRSTYQGFIFDVVTTNTQFTGDGKAYTPTLSGNVGEWLYLSTKDKFGKVLPILSGNGITVDVTVNGVRTTVVNVRASGGGSSYALERFGGVKFPTLTSGTVTVNFPSIPSSKPDVQGTLISKLSCLVTLTTRQFENDELNRYRIYTRTRDLKDVDITKDLYVMRIKGMESASGILSNDAGLKVIEVVTDRRASSKAYLTAVTYPQNIEPITLTELSLSYIDSSNMAQTVTLKQIASDD